MKTALEILNCKDDCVIYVDENATIHEALRLMNANHIGSMVVKKGDDMVGIWTERDLVNNANEEGFNPKSAKVSDKMSSPVKSVPHTATTYEIMDTILGLRLRHLGVEKDGKVVGILSAGDVMRAALVEKNDELKKLNSMVSWEYYEKWNW